MTESVKAQGSENAENVKIRTENDGKWAEILE